MKSKFYIFLICIFCLTLIFGLSSLAMAETEEETMQTVAPRYTLISSIDANIDVRDDVAYYSGSVETKGICDINMVVQLQQKIDGQWKMIDYVSVSEDGIDEVFGGDTKSVDDSGSFRTVVTTTVSNSSGQIESGSCTSTF